MESCGYKKLSSRFSRSVSFHDIKYWSDNETVAPKVLLQKWQLESVIFDLLLCMNDLNKHYFINQKWIDLIL